MLGYSPMAWVKVPAENHPIFQAALPNDPRVDTLKMFGGVAAKVNGNVFAGLFGRSTMVFESMMQKAAELRRWLMRAFEGALELPTKATKSEAKKTEAKRTTSKRRK